MRIVDKKWQVLPILTLSVSMLVGLYGFYITLERLVIERERSHLISLMSDVIYVIREDSAKFTPELDVDDYIGDLTQANTQMRIQVIDPSGLVIADTDLSDHALARVENHANRPDFQQALETGEGSDVRFSTVTSTDRIYYSKKKASMAMTL